MEYWKSYTIFSSIQFWFRLLVSGCCQTVFRFFVNVEQVVLKWILICNQKNRLRMICENKWAKITMVQWTGFIGGPTFIAWTMEIWFSPFLKIYFFHSKNVVKNTCHFHYYLSGRGVNTQIQPFFNVKSNIAFSGPIITIQNS